MAIIGIGINCGCVYVCVGVGRIGAKREKKENERIKKKNEAALAVK